MAEQVDYFKTLIWETAVDAAIKEFLAASLFWGAPPLSYVVMFIVPKVANIMYDKTKKFINFKRIAFVNELAEKEFTKSSVLLGALANRSGINSEEFKKARNEEKEHLKNFVNFGVARR